MLSELLARPSGRILLRTDGTIDDLPLSKLNLAGWQALVGGCVQIVQCPLLGRARDVMLNENGIDEELPVNRTATAILATFALMVAPGVRGDVVIAWGKGEMK